MTAAQMYRKAINTSGYFQSSIPIMHTCVKFVPEHMSCLLNVQRNSKLVHTNGDQQRLRDSKRQRQRRVNTGMTLAT